MNTYVPVCMHTEFHGSAFITCAFVVISVLNVNSLVNICIYSNFSIWNIAGLFKLKYIKGIHILQV